MGRLPGQGNALIRFSPAPNTLWPAGRDKPIGWCGGYTPAGCYEQGYYSSDVFYLESCIFSMMCSNREELWQLRAGQDFYCTPDYDGFAQMRDWLL